MTDKSGTNIFLSPCDKMYRKKGANRNIPKRVGRNQKKKIVFFRGYRRVVIYGLKPKVTGFHAKEERIVLIGYAAVLMKVYGRISLFIFFDTKGR